MTKAIQDHFELALGIEAFRPIHWIAPVHSSSIHLVSFSLDPVDPCLIILHAIVLLIDDIPQPPMTASLLTILALPRS
jgi:hypothetical protein